jgi:threonine/homoserine/homoserine lactone efflux protein
LEEWLPHRQFAPSKIPIVGDKEIFGLFFQGVLLGFSIAAPVGPIGVLCIRRTLSNGGLSGFISGLGAATADAIYGSLAALGLTLISGFLIERKVWLGVLGGLFLCYLGFKTFLDRPKSVPRSAHQSNYYIKDCELGFRNTNLLSDYATTLFLTLTNPMTILSFAAIYAGLGLGLETKSTFTGLWLVLGVFLGSALWWVTLSFLTNLLREKFLKYQGLYWINRISGVVLVAFGIGALFSVMRW